MLNPVRFIWGLMALILIASSGAFIGLGVKVGMIIYILIGLACGLAGVFAMVMGDRQDKPSPLVEEYQARVVTNPYCD